MCLVDTSHGFYIRALKLLPPQCSPKAPPWYPGCWSLLWRHGPCVQHYRQLHLVRHCLQFPPLRNNVEAEAEPDVLDTASVLRMVVRSVDGFVTAVCSATGFSEHKAVEYLRHIHCDLSVLLQATPPSKFPGTFRHAAKHPQHVHLASFLTSLADNEPELGSLLRTSEEGRVLSDASAEQLYGMTKDRSSSTMLAPRNTPELYR